MENVVGKLLVATGLLISGSVAFLPLTSHATSNTGNIFDCGGTASSAAGAEKPKECATATYNNLKADGTVDDTKSSDGSTQINVTVQDVLAFDAEDAAGFSDDKENAKITAFPGMVKYGRIYANVRSAKPYTISLSATNDTFLTNADESGFIPARANPGADKSKSGWGIADGLQQGIDTINFDSLTYKAITNTPEVFYDGGANDDYTVTNFPVAVTANDKIPQGTYTGEVTITAAVKQ